MTLAELQKVLLDTATTITNTTRELANQAAAATNAQVQAERLASGLQTRLDEALKKAEEQAAKFAADRQRLTDNLAKRDAEAKASAEMVRTLTAERDQLRARFTNLEGTPEWIKARRKEAEQRKARAEAEAKSAAEELEKLK